MSQLEPAFCEDCGLLLEDGPPCLVCKAEADGTFRVAVDQLRGAAYEGPSRVFSRRVRSVRDNRPRRSLRVD